MLLDILDNLPWLRMSSNQFKMILCILKECKVSNVPLYYAFRKMQNELRQLCGSEPKVYTSMVGNRFFVNDIRDSVARDFANPEVAKHLNFYPEETKGPISEVWQAERWKEFTPSELTPMFSQGLRQFYIDEVAELDTGERVIPRAWIKRNGVICADCVDALLSTTGWGIGTEVRSVPATRFSYNYYDVIERIGDKILWAEIARGDDLYVVMVPLWADNVSGNKPKQYNKHINMYMANSNLPGKLLQQEYFVRFVSTSPHATSPEQFSAIKEQIQATHTDPIQCYNAETHRNCRVILRVPGLPADNPQQSEEASHMGGNSNLGCRRCDVGGPHTHTELAEGYHSLHFVTGNSRSAAETKKTLQDQIDLAMYGIEAPIKKLQTATGVKDKIAQHWIERLLSKARQMKADHPGRIAEAIAEELRLWLTALSGEKMNPLLDIAGTQISFISLREGLDPNRDTPVEILHTILLGIIKYVWSMLHTSWSPAQQDLFVIRLQSTDIDGLTVPPICAPYMMQYRNGLIGKHFKTLMQTMVFHMHGLVSPELFRLVKAVYALGSVLWVHEIDDMKQYTADLTILIGNVLDAFGDCEPSKIIVKIKLHLLPHLIEDAIRFGPPIRNSTEAFECFNAIFLLCSILSNHQAPSHDIAYKFSSMDRLKHLLSGGFWKQDGAWVCAGSNVCNILKTMPIIQRHLGWVPPGKLVSGASYGNIRLATTKKAPLLKWNQTQVSSSIADFARLRIIFTAMWRSGITVTAKSGDSCKKGSWVFARDINVSGLICFAIPFVSSWLQDKVVIGRILEILVAERDDRQHTNSSIITLEEFILSERLHPDFDMPVVHRPLDRANPRICVLANSIVFLFSAEHDCRLADCQATALCSVTQERVETSRTVHLIEHAEDDHFIVNLAGLHNGTLLQRNLPRALTVPRPLYLDRKAHHNKIAAHLQASQATQRALTQEKRQATLARKALAAAELAENEADGEYSDDDEEDEEAEEEEAVRRRRGRKRRRI
ncbi:hypothetical protein B0H10DRAFT_2162124 [Mycena sp. CBHHK59/15]|nr:hypothetical protein B0H10DRAFT_2162124 [Mycena sp. CBHHK59/15]